MKIKPIAACVAMSLAVASGMACATVTLTGADLTQDQAWRVAKGEEVAIYRIEGDEDNEQLIQIEDDDELDEVFAEFCAQYEDFEDADEAAELDGADED